MNLGIDDRELASCVGCGLCLPHCPTFRVTGDELLSPRGRISLMRHVQWDGAEPDEVFVASMETCVQCRGCETACPSGVPFGHLIEATRSTLAAPRGVARPPWWQRWAMRVLGHHRLLLAGSSALALAQRARLVPSKRLGLPARLPLRRPTLRDTATPMPTREVVWLHTGCVMDAWLRDVHLAAQRVVEATGAAVRFPDANGSCCGALHTHAGLRDEAVALARKVMASMPGEAPILVNSAGCGAALKDYGHLLGTDGARRFAARVFDVHEWIAPRLDALPDLHRQAQSVIVQDPCHLRHVQKAHLPVRAVVGRVATVVELL